MEGLCYPVLHSLTSFIYKIVFKKRTHVVTTLLHKLHILKFLHFFPICWCLELNMSERFNKGFKEFGYFTNLLMETLPCCGALWARGFETQIFQYWSIHCWFGSFLGTCWHPLKDSSSRSFWWARCWNLPFKPLCCCFLAVAWSTTFCLLNVLLCTWGNEQFVFFLCTFWIISC